MAKRTIYLNEALNAVASLIPRAKEDILACVILNAAISECWRRYPWPSYMTKWEPFWLVPGVQDYPWVCGQNYAPNFDRFWAIDSAILVNLYQEPPVNVISLTPVDKLRETHFHALPRNISIEHADNAVRVFPRPPQNLDNQWWQVECTVKLTPAKVTPENIYTTLVPLEDLHFHAFLEVLKWVAYRILGDPRANEAMPVALEALESAAAAEGCRNPQRVIAPAAPLVGGGGLPPFIQWW